MLHTHIIKSNSLNKRQGANAIFRAESATLFFTFAAFKIRVLSLFLQGVQEHLKWDYQCLPSSG